MVEKASLSIYRKILVEMIELGRFDNKPQDK